MSIIKKYIYAAAPVLIGIFPILSLLSYNKAEAVLNDIVLPVLIVLTAAAVFIPAFFFVFKDIFKTYLFFSVSALLFFSYGHFHNFFSESELLVIKTIGRHRFLYPAWFFLIAFSFYLIYKSRRDFKPVVKNLNYIAVVLVILPLLNIFVYNFNKPTIEKEAENKQYILPRENFKAASAPDIYYIILDEYAGRRPLREIFNYDNSDIFDFFKKNNFYVVDDAKSNYSLTFLSMASSLNMEYLDELKGREDKDRAIPYEMIENSKVARFLKSHGYSFVHFKTWWKGTESNNLADIEIKTGVLNEFKTMLLKTTMFSPFEWRIILKDRRNRTLKTFGKLADAPSIKGPKFVFAHIIAPHDPYVFNENGEDVPETKSQIVSVDEKQKTLYLSQLIFINKKIKELVEEILKKSSPSPVIIIQSDHGSASYGFDNEDERLYNERMRIINVYHLPDGGEKAMHTEITPVNSFRAVFDYYFGMNYEILPNKSYFSNYDFPYKFKDVTDLIVE